MTAVPAGEVPDVRKAVEVEATPEEAFDVFAQRPLEWWPAHHVFVTDRRSITIEPVVGCRYYETGADGTTIDWGTVVEWDRPRRLVLTWRMGPGWRPVYDDALASLIEVDVTPTGPGTCEVALTHARLDRHGEIAPGIHAALQGPSPGPTLEQYAEVVARRVPPRAA